MSSSDYEDSQPAQTMDKELESKPRPSRSSHAGARRTSALYEQGGALDSQTSDSQWVSTFVCEPSSNAIELVDAAVQTEPDLLMELADSSSCCEEVEANNDLLCDELRRLQAACATVGANNEELRADNNNLRKDLAHQELMYDGIKRQLESVWGVLVRAPVVPDPTRQSQVAVPLPPVHATPPRMKPAPAHKHSHSVDGNPGSRLTMKAPRSTPAPVPRARARARARSSKTPEDNSLVVTQVSKSTTMPTPASRTISKGLARACAPGPSLHEDAIVISESSSDGENDPRGGASHSGSVGKRRRFDY